jgi:putative transcriptional regulator
MRKEDFAKLVKSIKQAGYIKRGGEQPSRIFKYEVPDVKTIRETLGVSQGKFALMIGVSMRTLQNWEQGRRKPGGPAIALLKIASKNPEAVLSALHT